jgi:hypothetical protein
MSNVHSILRSLIIYAICIPLAVFLGYQLPSVFQDRGSFVTVTVVLALLCLPLLIRFHHPLLLLTWNMGAVLFFLPGRPNVWFATIAVSFAISFTQRILNKEVRTISVPQLTWPLITIALVVMATALLTGGFGVRALGGSVYGSKRYFYIFIAIVGYFALAAYRIPRERAGLSIALFFLGGLTAFISDLFPVLGSVFPFLFWFFPPYSTSSVDFAWGITRFPGLAGASAAIFAFMMARYGIRGMFLSGKPWRLLTFVLLTSLGLYGGFRSMLIYFLTIFAVQFFLEGLHRTKLLPAMVLAMTLIGAGTLSFATKLPPTVQRAMAFLPISIDPAVRLDAEGSSEWRLRMWTAVLPQVPQYLLLGKGLAMTQDDYRLSEGFAWDAAALSEDQWGSALAGDYHNGPLSVVIPFGIWGMIAWIWFLVVGLRVLYCNYRYGDPALRIVNTFLLANFIGRMLMFWFIVGGFYSELMYYTGMLGLSVSLNGGVARPVPATVKEQPLTKGLASVFPSPRPAFGRVGRLD